jgi:hypothetical protein
MSNPEDLKNQKSPKPRLSFGGQFKKIKEKLTDKENVSKNGDKKDKNSKASLSSLNSDHRTNQSDPGII